MIIEEKTKWKEELRQNGGSYYLLISTEMLEYLGFDEKDKKEVVIEADKGRHGAFFGFGRAKE